MRFLVTCTRLYNPLCPSVGGWSGIKWRLVFLSHQAGIWWTVLGSQPLDIEQYTWHKVLNHFFAWFLVWPSCQSGEVVRWVQKLVFGKLRISLVHGRRVGPSHLLLPHHLLTQSLCLSLKGKVEKTIFEDPCCLRVSANAGKTRESKTKAPG